MGAARKSEPLDPWGEVSSVNPPSQSVSLAAGSMVDVRIIPIEEDDSEQPTPLVISAVPPVEHDTPREDDLAAAWRDLEARYPSVIELDTAYISDAASWDDEPTLGEEPDDDPIYVDVVELLDG